MTHYRNTSGDSGVAAYEVGEDFIAVKFSTGAIYTYNYSSAGSGNIETMKRLAASGNGLNSFINTNVKTRYARKGF
jgi:hypothetical protein